MKASPWGQERESFSLPLSLSDHISIMAFMPKTTNNNTVPMVDSKSRSKPTPPPLPSFFCTGIAGQCLLTLRPSVARHTSFYVQPIVRGAISLDRSINHPVQT